MSPEFPVAAARALRGFGSWRGLVWALLTTIASATASAEPLPAEVAGQVRSALLTGAAAALEGRSREALANLERAATLAPVLPGVQGALGAAALLLGKQRTARRVLARVPSMAVYHAMAVATGRGGLSKARGILSAHVREAADAATPAALFLTALSFAHTGQMERADEVLIRAIAAAPGALAEAFAPDPAAAMVREVLKALEAIDQVGEARAVLAMALAGAGRQCEAVALAESALDRPGSRGAALRTLVVVENAVYTRRTLDRVKRVLADEPGAEDALVAQVVLLHRLGKSSRASAALEKLPPVDDKYLAWEVERIRAELALASGDPSLAVSAAEAAIRADPKSNESLALLIRALLGAGKVDRALAFAGELLARQPIEVDPFALMAQVYDAKKSGSRAKEMRLRSRSFVAAHAKLEDAVRRREEVFNVVRDAERTGIGVAGLEALRGEHPELALPIDLALAKHSSRGFQRAARDRILARCKQAVKRLLTNREGWDTVAVQVSPYGQTKTVSAPLTAADPLRCGGGRLVR